MDGNKEVTRSKDYFDNLTMWSFIYYVLKGFAAKLFSHGVFVIMIILLTIWVCQLSQPAKKIDNIPSKEAKANETNSKTK
ncbi:hypothetical protein F6R80_001579 [Enterobacter asburiae]|nr:hypothetical protein [Enterobacter asburiae]